MRDHWLISLHLARRTGTGAVSLIEGLNATWTGANWRFTAVGVGVLFGLGIAFGVLFGVIGRWFVVHA